MILDRNEKVSKNNSLFMKLGYSETNEGNVLGGHGTIEAYMRNCATNGYTWYSTNSLSSGMNGKPVVLANKKAPTAKAYVEIAIQIS